MSDVYTKIRTNYFSVTNVEKYTNIIMSCMAAEEIIIIDEKQVNGSVKYGFVCDGMIYGLPETDGGDAPDSDEIEESDCEGSCELLYKELQKILPGDEAVIITAIGFERLSYITARCAVITRDKIKELEFDEAAVKLAGEMLGNPGFTTNTYRQADI